MEGAHVHLVLRIFPLFRFDISRVRLSYVLAGTDKQKTMHLARIHLEKSLRRRAVQMDVDLLPSHCGMDRQASEKEG